MSQAPVLGVFKVLALKSFKFNPDGVVVAVSTPSVERFACVPCPLVAADELQHRAVSANKKVSRNFDPPDCLKVRVGIPIELVGKQALNRIAAILSGWQAD